MEKPKIAVATIIWARDPQEEIVIKKSMELLTSQGIDVIAADGGSAPEFLMHLSSFANLSLEKFNSPGIFTQTLWSLKTASEYKPEYILYTESDKNSFFEQHLDELITSVVLNQKIDLIIPSRSLRSFNTFPENQRKTEGIINQLTGIILGKQGDYLYGPLLFRVELIELLAELNIDVGWGWRMYFICQAISKGYTVEHIELDLPCPLNQREESPEDVNYRTLQMLQNLEGILLSIGKNKNGG